jgi:hypothetical protein
MSPSQLRRIPRLLDVKPGRKQWDPKIAEMLRLLPAEVEREIERLKNNNQTKKGELK